MSDYIQPDKSISYKFGNDIKAILSTVANRFMGSNPPAPFVFRTFNTRGILCDKKGQYIFNLEERFTNKSGKYAYAFGKLWSENERTSVFSIVCYGPTKLYVNKQLAYCSNGEVEGYTDKKSRIPVVLESGWNSFFLQFERTATGFGCEFGNAMPQWEPCNFYSPFTEREGKAGFAFSEPATKAVFEENQIPDLNSEENTTSLSLLPDGSWREEELGLPAVSRVFQGFERGKAYAWTSIDLKGMDNEVISFQGEAFSELKLWFDGRERHIMPGSFEIEINTGFGKHHILIESSCEQDRQWGFRIEAYCNRERKCFSPPADIKGYSGVWLYLGVFDEPLNEEAGNIQDLYRIFDNRGESIYWCVDERDTVIRPFVENPLFGRWTYPLGVTLYGLLRYGSLVENEEIKKYVRQHVETVAKIHRYALYDKDKFGFPGVNHQITWLDALDDCGSFGSLMLEVNSCWQNSDIVRIAELIADYMMNVQIRREDGAFYRSNATMWIDDLYMCVPFLCRYYELAKDTEYLDEACRQILLFEKYLFMKDIGVMSHIYSFVHNKPNGIPWSRGNGWVLFSVSELLRILPDCHQEYTGITSLYNRLVEGYIKLQGSNGLWHQVLDRQDTYEEASSTAMFICAFSRGIINGYLKPGLKEKAIEAVFKAWKGLTERVIDCYGNIYGICRGSGFSFSPDYYKGLSWNFNDTHGIGIIILAGIGVIQLQAHLGKREVLKKEGS